MTAGALFDDETRLLLQAALAPAGRALAAFHAWRARYDLDAIGHGPRRLLPLAHANLQAAGCDDPLMGRIKGIRRFDWAHNQVILRGASAALGTLGDAGIDTVVLKGAAMIAGWYRDTGLRPLNDVDILVPTARVHEAIDRLAAAGWQPASVPLHAVHAEIVPRLPGWPFGRKRGESLDLHWHVLHQATQDDADAPFWTAARPAEVAGRPTRILSPEHQLFHACAHGMQANGTDRFSWPADAVWILRAAGERFDWDGVAALARHTGLTLQFATCLDFLRAEFDIAVPARTLAALADAPHSFLERAELRLRQRPYGQRGRIARALLSFQDFRRRTGDLIRRPPAAAVAPLLRDRWGLDDDAPVAGYGAARALRRPAWLRRYWLMRPWRQRIAGRDPPLLGSAPLAFAGLGGEALLHGWSSPEADGCWTDGPEAIALFRVPAAAGALSLDAVVHPFLAGAHRRVAVDVWANQRRVARWRFTARNAAPAPQRLTVPAGAVGADRRLALTFIVRPPRRPSAIGVSIDARRLGLFVHSLALSP